jgi:hypothetical protein
MALNEKYSYKDCTQQKFTKLDAKEFDNSEVVGTCFHQNVPKTKVFPVGMTGVKFQKCNLDNCEIPAGNTIEGGCHRWIALQKDGEDWFLDDNLDPVEPMNKALYEKLGLDVNPVSISATQLDQSVVQTKIDELEDALQADIKALEDAATWR